MPGELSHILGEISSFHLNILLLLGLALFGGTVGGRIFQKLRIPQVVGYIAIGIVLGQTGLKIVDENIISALQPFNYFALGLIGFMIGGELEREVFAKYGRQFIFILFAEGIGAFLAVSALTIVVGSFFLDIKVAWALGLLLGAIASATAPAATTDVLWEYKTRGPLTTTVLGIVAMDDGLALMLFAIASSIAGTLVGHFSGSIFSVILRPLYEIFGSLVVGALSGIILWKILRRYSEKERLLTFTIGTVMLVLGISIAIDVDMLLSAMVLGAILVNFTPRKSRETFKLVERFTPPIYVLFFVLFGAKLNVSHLTLSMGLLALAYLLGRTFGKMLGANFGARISRAPKTVQKYLPYCLFSQAGVAIGLSLLAGQRFPADIGNTIVIIITTTTFIVQIIGPPFTKYAVSKAGEVGLNITEEDLMEKMKAADIMDENVPLIFENELLPKILKVFGETENLYYPVVDENRKLLGIITIDNLKDTFMTSELNNLLVAHDLMEPPVATVRKDIAMLDVKDIMNKYNIDYLPVVNENDEVVGFIESRRMHRKLSRKMLELQKQAESLDKRSA